MDKRQIKQGDNRRLMGDLLHLWDHCKPDDVDENPTYFDKVITDILDREMKDPYSAAATPFRLSVGNPLRDFHTAEFMAWGVEKTVSEVGIPSYHLLWERVSEWKHVNIDQLKMVKGERRIRWNRGRQMHEVLEDGRVIFASADKEEAQKAA